MSAVVESLAVWLPGRGIVVGPVSFEISGLTLLTGRSGSGATALASALGGDLPRGALVRGGLARRPGRPEVWVHHVGADRLDPPLDVPLSRALGQPGPEAAALWGRLGGDADWGRSLRDLDPATYAAVPVLRGVLDAMAARRDHPSVLLVVDQPLRLLTPDLREVVGQILRDTADAGVDVCWVEHDLGTGVPRADRVVELVDEGDVVVHLADAWRPRRLPLPPQASLARALGLPESSWWDLDVLAALPLVQAAVPTASGLVGPSALAVVPVPAERAGVDLGALAGVDVTVGETLGVVPGGRDHRPALRIARRIAASVDQEPRPRPPLEWPGHLPVQRLTQAWTRARGGDADAALRSAARLAVVDGARGLARHSTGEQRALVWALSVHSGRTEVLDRPEAGLDAHARRLMASALRAGGDTATIVVSHDPEFLVRACHRLLVLPDPTDPEAPALLGNPALVAAHLPHPPVLRRAGSRALRVRDVLEEVRR